MLMMIGMGPVVDEPPGNPDQRVCDNGNDDTDLTLSLLDWIPSVGSEAGSKDFVVTYYGGCGSIKDIEVANIKCPLGHRVWAINKDGTKPLFVGLVDPFVMMAKLLGRGQTMEFNGVPLSAMRDLLCGWTRPADATRSGRAKGIRGERKLWQTTTRSGQRAFSRAGSRPMMKCPKACLTAHSRPASLRRVAGPGRPPCA